MMKRTAGYLRLGIAAAVILVTILLPVSVLDAEEVLSLERVLWTTGTVHFRPTFEDYDDDGVQDLIGRVYADGLIRVRILSAIDGSTIRQYDPPPGHGGASTSFGTRIMTLPDSDGDGKRELFIGDTEDVWAVKSSAGGGRVDLLPQVFSFSDLPYGLAAATSDQTALIASCDFSKLLFVDPRNGSVLARVSHNVAYGYVCGSLGNSAVNVGDLNGDGFDDFASSGVNVNHNPQPKGSVFILSGSLTTSGSSFVPLPSLPAGSVLAQLTGVEFIGWGEDSLCTTANLGDPYPDNDLTEFLLVSGSPTATYRGAIAAHVLTRLPDESFSVSTVAAYDATDSSDPDSGYGKEVVPLDDVNGDGVGDVVLFVAGHKDAQGQTLGRLLLVSGAGLLDGFSPETDVIQTIDGLPNAYFHDTVCGLGDYDGDGRPGIAVAVVYNGLDGIFGNCQYIYEVIPEPTTMLLVALGGLALLLRRQT